MTRGADYGLDAPGIVRTFVLGGAAIVLAGLAASHLGAPPHRLAGLGTAMLWMGGSFLLSGAMMVVSSRVGKLRARDRLLDRIALDPTASVLDIGCGRGLMLIGAAKRVPRGRATGVDLWSQKDQGSNSRDATLANAAAEGVADRVDVRNGDMRDLPFPDASFDAVVSSLAIHNVESRADRRRAIDEIARVVRPGGAIAIMDIAHVGEYADDLRAAGARDVRTLGVTPFIFPPTRVLVAIR
ncbi:MAG: class I SAM-dependent methyltransferase [Gemmatimonadaceae bacterium]